MYIPSKGSIFDTLVEMEQDLQSAISYAGGHTLQAIRKADYVLVKLKTPLLTATVNPKSSIKPHKSASLRMRFFVCYSFFACYIYLFSLYMLIYFSTHTYR